MKQTVKYMVPTCELQVIHKTAARKYQEGVIEIRARKEKKLDWKTFIYHDFSL